MLILTEKRPEKSLYFLGAKLLSLLLKRDKSYFVLELYEVSFSNSEIGFNRYLLALDWLFMLGLIELNQEGKITKCF